MIAAYNAGASRVAEWNKPQGNAQPLTSDQFVARIDIPSTRAYVTSILERYHRLKNNKQANAKVDSNKDEQDRQDEREALNRMFFILPILPILVNHLFVQTGLFD